jgi:nitroimidazol reductase NimA-like FMN-containing flavoprotein (pyridoxamine 5'-phosphate oxidase superfamily)
VSFPSWEDPLGHRRAGIGVRVVTPVEQFLARPLVAHVAAAGPTVTPVWFQWERGMFWWLTGAWSRLPERLREEPRVALVVDTCDLASGEILQVSVRGTAALVPLDMSAALRKLSKYLGDDRRTWPRERFLAPLDDAATALVCLRPDRPPVLKDLSYER